MKVGDMVRHHAIQGGVNALGSGLIVSEGQGLGEDEYRMWDVLWSDIGEVREHNGYELRLVEVLSVAQYKLSLATNNNNS